MNAAYAWGACENRRGNYDKAIEDYHLALNKDKEKPSSPMWRFTSPVLNVNKDSLYNKENAKLDN